jgi:hypothetical protein|tara:strand:+ start:274 stop:675 length:402 start_codon:yes stop_codon:yes gene_type:complete
MDPNYAPVFATKINVMESLARSVEGFDVSIPINTLLSALFSTLSKNVKHVSHLPHVMVHLLTTPAAWQFDKEATTDSSYIDFSHPKSSYQEIYPAAPKLLLESIIIPHATSRICWRHASNRFKNIIICVSTKF